MANGIADDPVSLCYMSSGHEKWIAPAMNSTMYLSCAVQKNLQTLRSFADTTVLESPSGKLACGENGPGRFMEPAEIVAALKQFRSKENDFAKSVLITAGRTEEAIDPVRYISNRSSGKTAVALAEAFWNAGFQVILVHGPMDVKIPNGILEVAVQSAQEMYESVLSRQAEVNAIVHCAAVADYRPKNISTSKIKDSRSQFVLELEPNPNILRDSVKNKTEKQVIVGFGLETDDVQKHGKEKLEKRCRFFGTQHSCHAQCGIRFRSSSFCHFGTRKICARIDNAFKAGTRRRNCKQSSSKAGGFRCLIFRNLQSICQNK